LYSLGQQLLRLSADEPQEKILEQIVRGAKQNERWLYADRNQVELASSSEIFYLVFNPAGEVVGGSGRLHGLLPQPPKGLFKYVKTFGQHTVTWQPEPQIRQAVVIDEIGGNRPGFVLVGRSLAFTEFEITIFGQLVFVGWLLLVGITVFIHRLAVLRFVKK
jgi:hypothetical protein